MHSLRLSKHKFHRCCGIHFPKFKSSSLTICLPSRYDRNLVLHCRIVRRTYRCFPVVFFGGFFPQFGTQRQNTHPFTNRQSPKHCVFHRRFNHLTMGNDNPTKTHARTQVHSIWNPAFFISSILLFLTRPFLTRRHKNRQRLFSQGPSEPTTPQSTLSWGSKIKQLSSNEFLNMLSSVKKIGSAIPRNVVSRLGIGRSISSLSSPSGQDIHHLPDNRNNTAVNVLVQCMMSCRKLVVSRVNLLENVQHSRQHTVNECCSRFWIEFEDWSFKNTDSCSPCCRDLFRSAMRKFNDVDFMEDLKVHGSACDASCKPVESHGMPMWGDPLLECRDWNETLSALLVHTLIQSGGNHPIQVMCLPLCLFVALPEDKPAIPEEDKSDYKENVMSLVGPGVVQKIQKVPDSTRANCTLHFVSAKCFTGVTENHQKHIDEAELFHSHTPIAHVIRKSDHTHCNCIKANDDFNSPWIKVDKDSTLEVPVSPDRLRRHIGNETVSFVVCERSPTVCSTNTADEISPSDFNYLHIHPMTGKRTIMCPYRDNSKNPGGEVPIVGEQEDDSKETVSDVTNDREHEDDPQHPVSDVTNGGEQLDLMSAKSNKKKPGWSPRLTKNDPRFGCVHNSLDGYDTDSILCGERKDKDGSTHEFKLFQTNPDGTFKRNKTCDNCWMSNSKCTPTVKGGKVCEECRKKGFKECHFSKSFSRGSTPNKSAKPESFLSGPGSHTKNHLKSVFRLPRESPKTDFRVNDKKSSVPKSTRFQDIPQHKSAWCGSIDKPSTNAESKNDSDLESHYGKVGDEPDRKPSFQSRPKRAANRSTPVHRNPKRSRCHARSSMNFVVSPTIQVGPKNSIYGQPRNDVNDQSSSSEDDASSDGSY